MERADEDDLVARLENVIPLSLELPVRIVDEY